MGDPLIFIRAIHFAATLTLAGALIFAVAVVGPIMRPMERAGEALRARLLRIAWWSFAAALISGVAWLVVLAADISERAPSEAFFGGIVWTVLLHTTFGHDWLARLVLAALLAAALSWILQSIWISGAGRSRRCSPARLPPQRSIPVTPRRRGVGSAPSIARLTGCI